MVWFIWVCQLMQSFLTHYNARAVKRNKDTPFLQECWVQKNEALTESKSKRPLLKYRIVITRGCVRYILDEKVRKGPAPSSSSSAPSSWGGRSEHWVKRATEQRGEERRSEDKNTSLISKKISNIFYRSVETFFVFQQRDIAEMESKTSKGK